jgi:hypothetical protein
MDPVTATQIGGVLKLLNQIEEAVEGDLKRQGLPVNVDIVRRRTDSAVALYVARFKIQT